MVNDHFPYIFQDGHWISTAAADRHDQIVLAATTAAKVAFGLVVGWFFFVVFFCM